MHEQSVFPMSGRDQPSRADVVRQDRLTVVDHPLGDHLLSIIRDRYSSTSRFGAAARQLGMFLLWECARSLTPGPSTVTGFDGSDIEVRTLHDVPAGLSILRAGEVFAGAFREIFPTATLFHLGIRRDEQTLGHTVYLDTVRAGFEAQRLMILDPMLATGGSVIVALKRVRECFAGPVDVVSLVSAPIGVQSVLDADPQVQIVTAALDNHLNERGYIVPGLGDAGDRFFGTDEGW